MSDEVRSIPPIEPVLDPKKDYVEINSCSLLGLVLCGSFHTGCWLFLCLKIGQTVDACNQYLYLLWVQQLF